MQPPTSRYEPTSGSDAVSAVLRGFGPYRVRLCRVLAALVSGRATLDFLVRESGMSRRSVEKLLAAAGEDVTVDSGEYRMRDDAVDSYRRFLRDGDAGPSPDVITDITKLIDGAPAAKERFDHIVATQQTAMRRARWLDETYDLTEHRLLFLGDHDLTALAAGIVNPGLEAAVVDVDEDLLAYVDSSARRLGLDVRCYYADLRFSFPQDLLESSDIVFTDPPYTPDGVELFAARSVQSLRDREFGHIVISYGFSERTPKLGHNVQRALVNLGMCFEAILPGFNAYRGAQAIGGSSDLYVCRPTSRTPTELPAPRQRRNVYTRGPQSEEAVSAGAVTAPVLAAATANGDVPLGGVVGDGAAIADVAHARLETLFATGLPRAWAERDGVVVIDLASDPGPWLPRALLAANAHRLAVLVPNNHDDIATAVAQRSLRAVLDAKYTLRFRRGIPDSGHALLEATLRDGGTDPATVLRAHVLCRAHGSLATVWREGLIRATKAGPGDGMTKNEARSRIADAAATFPRRLVDIPRHRIRELFAAMDESLAGAG